MKNQVLENIKVFYTKNKVLSLVLLILILLTISISVYFVLNNTKSDVSNDVSNNKDFNFFSSDIAVEEKSLDYDTAKKVYNNFLNKNENVITALKPDIYARGAIKMNGNVFVKSTYEQKLGSRKCNIKIDKNEDVYLNSKITSLLYRDNDKLYYKEIYNHPELKDFYTYIKLDNFKDKVTETIHYNGGDYAVKTYYKELDSSDSKYFTEYIIEDMDIPNDVRVVTRNLNNQEFYIVRYQNSNFNCDKPGNTVIQDFYLDKDSYQVVKLVSYVKNDFDVKFDLINEITVKTSEQQNVNFENIKNDFKLDANVEIKDFNLSDNSQQDSTENKQKTFDSLNISFIRPTTGNVEIGYVYVNTNVDANFSQVQLNEFITDRKFFPKGKLGDELYNNAKKLNNNPTNNDISKSDFYLSRLKVSYIFSDDRNMAWDVSVYSSFKSIDEYLSSTPKENIYRFNKNFSGKNLEVARVKVNNTISGSEKYRYILFYNGYIYDFDIYNQENGNSISDISQYNIGIFDKESNEFNKLRDYVHKNLYKQE